MASPDTPTKLSTFSQDALLVKCKNWIAAQNLGFDMRSYFLERDRIYQREMDQTEENQRAKSANKAGDASKVQNVTIPVVGPQVEAAHAYLVETFLTSYPIFPVVSGPDYAEPAAQIDAVMGEAAVTYQYARHLSMAFRDGLKYNLMAVEVDWKTLKTASISNSPSEDIRYGTPTEVIYAGNMLKRVDPYNLILDTNVSPAEVHMKGEFVGYTELLSRIQLKQRFLDLDPLNIMNEQEAFRSSVVASAVAAGYTVGAYYVPSVNLSAIGATNTAEWSWLNWMTGERTASVGPTNLYEFTTLYVRIIPREFGIHTKQSGIPQIYKLHFVNQSVLVYAERKSNAHNYLPIIVGQFIEDGLNYQTKSFLDNAAPYQAMSSALYNSGLISQRRKVYDRIFYDPSRISKKDIDKVDPVARIPIRETAYGKPISESFAVVPFRDDGVPLILGIAREIVEMADVSSGQNRVQRGQFQKGNKTRSEFDTVMDKSDSRMRTIAVIAETSFIQPIKYILKMNILQYQPPAQLYNVKTQSLVKVDPGQLRTIAWQFQTADGVLPVSKLTGIDLMPQMLQAASVNPALAAEYDLVGAYMYSLKMQGAAWIDYFKRNPQQAAAIQNAANPPQTGA